MAAPTPEHDAPRPSAVLQELSAQGDPASPAGLPPAGVREGLRHTFRALGHQNFRLFMVGQVVSLVGTWMQTVAQSWLVYRLTHSELHLGAAWFCTQIPVFAFGPLGGLISDRFSRHRLVILTQALSMLQALALAALTLSGQVQVWHVLALALVLGTINAFDIPARQALIIHMTSQDDLLNAISLNSGIFNAARIVGPALAGLLVAAVGEGVCFLVNGISFLAVIGCLMAMRFPDSGRTPSPDSPWAHLVDGFRYAYHHSTVRLVLVMMAAVTLSGMPAVVLMPFFADDIFHRGSRGLGFLLGAMGAGAVIGTLVLAAQKQVSGLGKVILSSSVLTSLGFVLFAVSHSFYFSLALMPFIGFGVMRQTASANTLIQSVIPDEYRGRIMALYAMTVVGLGPFGSLAAGSLANAYGPRVTVLLGGVLGLIACVAFWIKRRSLVVRAEVS